jgi:hypothetical protein
VPQKWYASNFHPSNGWTDFHWKSLYQTLKCGSVDFKIILMNIVTQDWLQELLSFTQMFATNPGKELQIVQEYAGNL